MDRALRRLIPTMFHRRLLLLAVIACAATVVLAARTARLTLREGDALRRQAENALSRDQATPTLRGTIFDRKGQVLAKDRPSYDLAVSYKVLTGDWVRQCAEDAAEAHDGKVAWARRSATERQTLVDAARPAYERQLGAFFQALADVSQQEPVVLEQRRSEIVRRVDRVARSYWKNRIEQQMEATDGAVTLRDVVRQPIREQVESHILVEDLTPEARLALERTIEDSKLGPEDDIWREASIRFAARRDYPWDMREVPIDRTTLPLPLKSDEPLVIAVRDIGRHVIGGIREHVWADDDVLKNYPFSPQNLHGYKPSDPIGASGIEASREGLLRGQRGMVTNYLDGRPPSITEPAPGQNITLTLDIRLQARIQAIMDPSPAGLGLMRSQPWHRKPQDKKFVQKDGEEVDGSALVLDIETGEVLAAVSVPWYRPVELGEDSAAIERWERIHAPWLNRVVAKPYTPGSTVKPLVLTALYTEHKLGYNDRLECAPGYLYPDNPTQFQCWMHKQGHGHHDALTGAEAICRSCNMFFYRSGLLLGQEKLRQWYANFGLGERLGCGLEEEIAGTGALAQSPQEAALNSIGQGPIEWTPLQAANAYAIIARGGIAISPTFIRSPKHDRRTADLHVDHRTTNEVMEGLYLSANDRFGTTMPFRLPPDFHEFESNFNLDGVEVYAKSGTAEAPALRLARTNPDGTRAESEVVREGDHAWTISIAKRAGAPRPQYVVAVVVEYGGSGGQTAAPIVNQILHALNTEGYFE